MTLLPRETRFAPWLSVLTAIALRHENILKNLGEQMRDMLTQMRAMVSQHSRFNDRLRRLEEQQAE